MELGGNVGMLDRDDSPHEPWTLVQKKAKDEQVRQKIAPWREECELYSVIKEVEGTARRPQSREGKYEVVKVTADSGAADHVAPRSVASHLKIQETEASRQGVRYVAANGQKIANVGQKKVQGLTDEGIPLGMTWQIADIKKPLASIGRMCDAGNVAIFTKHGGYVVPKKTLEKTLEVLDKKVSQSLRMEREGGVYNFNLWIPRPPARSMSSNRYAPLQEVDEEEDFGRLGEDVM